jgi:hypothetical protein
MLRKATLAVVLCPLFVLGATVAQAVTIDVSSPQAGTEVQPGGAIEMTVTVTNETTMKDCIAVVFKLTVDGIKHPVQARGYLRLKLEAGESVTETIALVVPEDLELAGPTPAIVDITATGNKTQTSDSETLDLTLVP